MRLAEHRIISGACVALALVCAACTFAIPLDATLDEPPLVEPLPLAVGIQYAEGLPTLEWVEQEYTAEGIRQEMKFQLGNATVALFDQIVGTMFEKTTPVEPMPERSSLSPGIDAILHVRLSSFSWEYPHTSRGEALLLIPGTYSARIVYEIKFYSAQQELITEWRVSGDATNEAPYLTPIVSGIRSETVELAMHNAIAQFITQFEDDPKIDAWLKSSDLRPQPNEV